MLARNSLHFFFSSFSKGERGDPGGEGKDEVTGIKVG